MKFGWIAGLALGCLLVAARAALPAKPPLQSENGSEQLSAGPPARCAGGLRWIVNAGSLKRSEADFPLDLQTKYFNSPCTFLVEGPQRVRDYVDWNVVRTRTIRSLAELDGAVNDSTAQAVLYDPEAWEMTPRDEQQDPARAGWITLDLGTSRPPWVAGCHLTS